MPNHPQSSAAHLFTCQHTETEGYIQEHTQGKRKATFSEMLGLENQGPTSYVDVISKFISHPII